jgi:ADP-ribose pyrophosphatase YjhB (NUDIX family)
MEPRTLYGAAIGLFKGKEVYLSRRIDTPLFPKKWQFLNGRLKGIEQSQDGAVRIVEEQTGIKVDKSRLHYINSVTIAESGEFYYVYLVHLQDSEIPVNTDNKYRSDWKLFNLTAASVLDLVPGIRHILKKLNKCLIKVEAESDPNRYESTDTYI